MLTLGVTAMVLLIIFPGVQVYPNALPLTVSVEEIPGQTFTTLGVMFAVN